MEVVLSAGLLQQAEERASAGLPAAGEAAVMSRLAAAMARAPGRPQWADALPPEPREPPAARRIVRRTCWALPGVRRISGISTPHPAVEAAVERMRTSALVPPAYRNGCKTSSPPVHLVHNCCKEASVGRPPSAPARRSVRSEIFYLTVLKSETASRRAATEPRLEPDSSHPAGRFL